MSFRMTPRQCSRPLSVLIKRSGIDFYTRRVLQRWQRGEISTDTAVDLLAPAQAERLIGTWRNPRPDA
jgi:hypothetical protein